ncbi:hypothetical protein METBIDRAFT_13792 [Metschnikowia bicuspidata var. bicuspidata NRRL YB-4993]|uniref:Uncharacterized protein n=1 Tax=Metschnikowia bicuspidata var. bicuspidata NRRL YB-4993 TaxID=869754 RepID=A0A1A0H510_9ASCO|nr:hypothetical protein METBIDRAFT_13792 [Metschnikowia bicuspidata var. bicuspidata NRRL YB-4993]OBA19035.1 hypothetical protein METBIDRAFT_13792 [Metschnikowia bicuspidata var. bicuspidata NRRL YB-4993]
MPTKTTLIKEVAQTSAEPTPLSVRFESICTTDVNGVIYKLARKDAEPFEQSFNDRDLLFKVNVNKSDKIKLHLRWIPVVVLPFLKKILFGGMVQPSPLPELLKDLKLSGADIRITDDPFEATHYVSLTDQVDYNMQIAILRALPIVSKEWFDMLANCLDDVDSWLFTINSDLYLLDTRGNDLNPNHMRTQLLSGSIAVLLSDDKDSKECLKLKKWVECLNCTQILVKSFEEVDNWELNLGGQLSQNRVYMFCVQSFAGIESLKNANKINTTDDLWSAVLDADTARLRSPQLSIPVPLQLEEKIEPIPLSQRRKRRKLERVEDTNFFLFTPLLSSKPQLDTEIQSKYTSFSQTVQPTVSDVEFELEISQQKQNGLENSSRKEVDSENVRLKPKIKTEFSTQGQDSDIYSGQNYVAASAESTLDSSMKQVGIEDNLKSSIKNENSKSLIVPQISLADAIKSTKQKASDSINHELAFNEGIAADMKKLLVIQDLELRAPSRIRSLDEPSFHGRKNFKKFRKNGCKQNSITRTFIELVDTGNDVYFKDLYLPQQEQDGREKLENDFEAEMEDVRGYQPETVQLFVNEVSDNEREIADEVFQFLSKRDDAKDVSPTSLHDITVSGRQAIVELRLDDDEDDDDVRFSFTRKN